MAPAFPDAPRCPPTPAPAFLTWSAAPRPRARGTQDPPHPHRRHRRRPALLGALLGTAAGDVASIAWFRGSALNGGVGALANAPIGDLLFIVVGMPLIAVAIGWLLAGREPPAIAHQPIE